ncbi:DUF6318 family protein [uncultured Rothia sp.]|jgi:hypothetical protein|uniref:DUF6318 family protein n=1 Tax=uncultured Rothia sp. TaxID=316088 RepID=UPI0025EBD6C7|nr:DUF6318 family protein [uncultured Rothia sp.]
MIDSEKLPKEFIYMDDFSGEYSLATACLTGEYIPANQDHPAYSAPLPDYAYSRQSATSFVRELFDYIYYYSCQNYALLASDIRGLEDPWREDENFFPAIRDLFEEGKGWVVTPDIRILSLHVLEGRPRITNSEQEVTEWKVRFDIRPDAKVYRKDTGEMHPIAEFDTRGLLRDGSIHGTMRTVRTKGEKPTISFIPEDANNASEEKTS